MLDWRPERSRAALLIAALAALVAGAVVLLPLSWAGLLVLGSLAASVTLLNPLLGLLMVTFSIPFGSLLSLPVGSVRVGITECLVWLTLASWVLRMVAQRRVNLQFTWLGMALVLLVGAMLLSLLSADSLELASGELLKWLEVLGVYAMVSHELDERWLRALVAGILGAGALTSLQGIYQFSFRVGPEAFLLFGRFMRAYGSFDQPNPYAGYLGLSLTLGLGVFLACLMSRAQPAKLRWALLAGGSGVLMLVALIMSWSRGAWLGLGGAIVAMGVAALLRFQKRTLLSLILVFVLLAGLVLGGAVHMPSSVTQRVIGVVPYLGLRDVRGLEVTDANFSVLERMAHWQAALDMWSDRVWLGVGIGNYPVAYARYALPAWQDPLGHAHNYYLNIGAEAGLVGLLVFLLVWFLALASAWRASRTAVGWRAGVGLGIVGAIVDLSIHNVFDDLFVHGIYLLVAILLGMATFIGQATH